MVWGAIAGAGVSVVGGIIGGGRSAAAAAEAARAQNKAMMAKYQYDLDMWDAKRSQLQAERMETIDRIMVDARNQGQQRAWQDAANERKYQHDLQIRDIENEANFKAFERSEDIYTDTTDLNSKSAKAAMDSEIVALEESEAAQAFDRNEAYIEMLQAEGELRATGARGRSASKVVQSTLADYGRQMEMLNASSISAGRNTRAVLEEIIRDKTSADLTAYASKMLKPTALPDPIKADKLPVPEFTLPRVLQDYDFGPQPVKGVMASPGAAASAAWGQAISGIASGIGGAVASTSGMGRGDNKVSWIGKNW